MTKGGSRVRSGPGADPNSRTSERKRAAAKKSAAASTTETPESAITNNEFDPAALPARGRSGRAPAFPLPKTVRYKIEIGENGKPMRVVSEVLSAAFRKRELALWAELWTTPQAVAWEREPYRWPTIAKYARIMATTEAEPDASAALLSRERELRIECGLTPDGLKVNGWAIAPDQLAERRAAKRKTTETAKKTSPAPVRRLRG